MYDLESIKAAARHGTLRISFSANRTLFGMGGTLDELYQLVQMLSVREQFYKSMTSHADHRIWQDVYHVAWHDVMMYLKFTIDEEGYLVISFKPR